MSRHKIIRAKTIKRVVGRRQTQVEAAAELDLSERQVKRLCRAYRKQGPRGLLSKQRGKPSNHQLAPGVRERALQLIRKHYPDFGPTLAAEKLAERDGVALSNETVRQLMIADGLWKPRRQHDYKLHPTRERRSCFGELIQIDGSPHAWFEHRASKCTLIVFIDDATSRLMQLRFVPAETTFAYFHVLRDYIVAFGKPAALYSDKFGVFRVNQPYLGEKAGQTQFGRAMGELDIQLICANSPQAKGRVERANLSLQDRLVKELRLRTISDMAEGNAYVPEFVAQYNAKFARGAAVNHNAHRPLRQEDDLGRILTLQSGSRLSKNLTLQHDRVLYQITEAMPVYRLRHQKVVLRESEDGNVVIDFNGKSLAYRIYHRAPRQGQIASVKEIDAMLSSPHPAKGTESINPPTLGNSDVPTSSDEPAKISRVSKRKPVIPPHDHPWRVSKRREIDARLRYRALKNVRGRKVSPNSAACR